MMTDLKVAQTEKWIVNAMSAREMSKTDWSKNYWDTVLAYLLRQANRLN